MNSTAIHRRHANESAISALSIVMVAVIAISIALAAQHIKLPDNRAASKQSSGIDLFPHDPDQSPQTARQGQPAATELEARFQQAVVMLHAGEYEHAVTALHRVLELSPRMPEAYVNMGFALIGLKRYKAARDFFQTASDIRPYQGNAYWGLAISLEQLGDLKGALGAMRTYIHLAPPDDPYVRHARSALWEWETTLARGPLSDEETEFLKRGAREWDDRNNPDRDRPEKGDTNILVRSIN